MTSTKRDVVHFGGLTLQIPQDQYRYHYVKVKVRVHRYTNDELAILHGHRKLGTFDSNGKEIINTEHKAA